MSGVEQVVGQKSVHGCVLVSLSPTSLLFLPLSTCSSTSRSGPTSSYLKLPNTLFGNLFAVCQQGTASVGPHVEAVGRQHREQVAPVKLYAEVERKLPPGAKGAEGCY